jgi:hypothetical protein
LRCRWEWWGVATEEIARGEFFLPGTLVVEKRLPAIGVRRTSESGVTCVSIDNFSLGLSTGNDTE